MRDARRIKETDGTGRSMRLAAFVVMIVGVIAVSYNIGLQAGMARAAVVNGEVVPETPVLAALDSAQQKHDAMKFYTRLTQEEPAASVAEPMVDKVEPERVPVKLEAQDRPASELQVTAKETSSLAAARLEQLKATPVSPSEPTLAPANFTVQVSAFQTQEEADAYKSSLNRKGYHPYVVAAEIPGKGVWFRVRVGRFDDKDSANETKAKLALANIPSFVVAAQ